MGKIAENGLRPPQTGIWQDFLVGVVMLWKPGAGYPCKTKRMRKVGLTTIPNFGTFGMKGNDDEQKHFIQHWRTF